MRLGKWPRSSGIFSVNMHNRSPARLASRYSWRRANQHRADYCEIEIDRRTMLARTTPKSLPGFARR